MTIVTLMKAAILIYAVYYFTFERKPRLPIMSLVATLTLVAVIGVACGPVEITTPIEVEGSEPACEYVTRCAGYSVNRFVDHEAQVVCWIKNGPGGLSCLPLSETALEKLVR